MLGRKSKELPNSRQLDDMLKQLRAGKVEITQDGKPVNIKGKLGEGGTKTVYDVEISGRRSALAIPNSVDGVGTMQAKWSEAQKEPGNTSKVRGLGVPTNTRSEITPIILNGVGINAIEMDRYEDLPVGVLDGKNRRSSTHKGRVFPEEITDESFGTSLSGIAEDIAKLVKNGVGLARDSINTCIEDGKVRLYVNDMGKAKFGSKRFQGEEAASFYARSAVGSLINAVDEDEWSRVKEFVNVDGKIEQLSDNLTQQVLKKLRK